MDEQPLVLAIAEAIDPPLQELLTDAGIQTKTVATPADCRSCNVILIDKTLLAQHKMVEWLKPECALLVPKEIADTGATYTNFQQVIVLPTKLTPENMIQAIKFGGQFTQLFRLSRRLDIELESKGEGLARLVDVGIALSSETDLECLLEKILKEGQQLVGCDAASLFLVDNSAKPPALLFKLIRNSTTEVPFKEQQVALDKSSIAGYCAITGKTLNVDDAYTLEEDSLYQFNRSFDLAVGYRSVNMVVLPMVDQEHKVVGVLQFINRKIDPNEKLSIPALTEQRVKPFDTESVSLLQAMASQAAIAIENRRLLDDVKNLFDGFVQASVFAIERRDPTTSGHSFRVADLCEAVAASVDASEQLQFKRIKFSEEQMRELRYSALLHDFGKVGVREHILTKAKKLSPANCEILHYRVALAKSYLDNQTLSQLLNLALTQRGLSADLRQQIESQNKADCQQLEQYLKLILEANEPTILAEGSFEHLEKIKSHLVRDHHGDLHGLISEQEFKALSIPRGSLSTDERLEIESHVQHTIDFLSLIPWTDNLSGIPAIAGAHHEKLDGSGYPQHLPGQKIPLQSRIMTVCDIYDALTAADRPYKQAMPRDKALGILEAEAQRGLVDANVVQVFIDAKAYTALEGKEYGYSLPQASEKSQWVHHVCDYDLFKARHELDDGD